MRILIADINGKRAEYVSEFLRKSDYTPDVAHDEKEMHRVIKDRPPAAVILALSLPERDCLRLIRDLRAVNIKTPIVLVTALGKDVGIRALDAGADDYLTEPLHSAELLARLRALFRRSQPDPPILCVATLEMNRRKRIVTQDKLRIELTNREFALLEMLMLASPEPVSKTALIEHVWQGRLSSYTNVVNVIINRLRNKISLPGTVPLLHTIRGVGYALRTVDR
jgi:DNA-binding response OmpR family regulator